MLLLRIWLLLVLVCLVLLVWLLLTLRLPSWLGLANVGFENVANFASLVFPKLVLLI